MVGGGLVAVERDSSVITQHQAWVDATLANISAQIVPRLEL